MGLPRAVLAGVFFLSSIASAAPLDVQQHRCVRGEQVRTVTVRIHDAARRPACDVRYQKITELSGHDKVLWRAKSGLKFCREKALEFRAKLERWNWKCAVTTTANNPTSSPRHSIAAPALGSTDNSSTYAKDSSGRAADPALKRLVDSYDSAVAARAERLRVQLAKAYGGARIQIPPALTALGDLNGDGQQDLVAGYLLEPRGGGVRCLLDVFIGDHADALRINATHRFAPNHWPFRVEIAAGNLLVTSQRWLAEHQSDHQSVLSLIGSRLTLQSTE